MALRVAEPPRETGDTVPVDDAVSDEAHRPRDDVGPGVPFRRARHGVGPAPLAGAETSVLRGGRGRIEADVGPLGSRGRTTGPAVDPRRGNSYVEPTVEADVAATYGAIAMFEVLQHAPIVAPNRQDYWRKSDIGIVRVSPVAKSGLWVRCSHRVRARASVRGPVVHRMVHNKVVSLRRGG